MKNVRTSRPVPGAGSSICVFNSILQSAICNPSVILSTVLIKSLYVVLVLSMVALLWAAAACYMRVRRHLAARHEAEEHEARQASRGD